MKISVSFVIQLCLLVNVWFVVYAFQPAPSRITTRSTSPHTSLVPFERKLHKGSSSRDRDTTSTLKMGLFGGKPDPTVQIPIQDYKDQWKVLPDMWETLAKIIPDNTMLTDNISPHTGTHTFKQVCDQVKSGAAAFQKLGVLPGSCVSVFAENSHRWLLAEQAIMKAGAYNAVRGKDAPVEELQYIYDNSKSMGAVVETSDLMMKISADNGLKSEEHGQPKFIIVLYPKGETSTEMQTKLRDAGYTDTTVLSFDDFMASSNKASFQSEFVPKDPNSLATLVYTSGTTSKPKGVMLTHKNLLYQVWGNSFTDSVEMKDIRKRKSNYDPWVGDMFVTILPCWHILERTAEYFCLSRGTQLYYTNLKNFKTDIATKKPQFIIAVPRLFETIQKNTNNEIKKMPASKQKLVAFFTTITKAYIYCNRVWKNMLVRDNKPNPIERLFFKLLSIPLWPLMKLGDKAVFSKIREKLGGKVKVMISGGSSIPTHIEKFYDLLGMQILNGYGLTETSPVIANRVGGRNVMGTVGKPPPGTELKVVNVDTKIEVPRGQPGLLLAKGPGVMQGYMANPTATAAAIDSNDFFDTGDLARINPSTGDFIITGRAKDTIVLSNGENIEPQSIEEAVLMTSPMVDQVMLVGQDEKYLGALVVLSVSELLEKGYIDAAKAKELSALIADAAPEEKGATPKVGASSALRKEADILNQDMKLKEALMSDMASIGANFRPWERVGAVSILLEPFAISNGLCTQTLKVKKDKVMASFGDNVKAIYDKKKK